MTTLNINIEKWAAPSTKLLKITIENQTVLMLKCPQFLKAFCLFLVLQFI